MNKNRLTFLVLFITSLILFIIHEVSISTTITDVEVVSIYSEGSIALLSLLSLIAIQWIEGSNRLYYVLTIAISCLLVSYIADTLDDLIEVRKQFSLVYEDSLGLIGYSLMCIGFIIWVQQTHSLVKQLVIMAHTDKLTGAFNRHKLNELFEREAEMAKRYKLPLSLILFDLDHFKKINDTFGHLTGDHVLIRTASIVQNEIRKSDYFARVGGEEFVILNPVTDSEGARGCAEKVRKAIEEFGFSDVDEVSASFGVTSCKPSESLESAIHRADLALYEAKDQGRNCVVIYDDDNLNTT